MLIRIFHVLRCFSLYLAILIITSCSKDKNLLEQVINEDKTETEESTDIQPTTVESFLTVEDFELPSQNSEGFTILKSSDSSRIIYVNNQTGDDATGVI